MTNIYRNTSFLFSRSMRNNREKLICRVCGKEAQDRKYTPNGKVIFTHRLGTPEKGKSNSSYCETYKRKGLTFDKPR